jgi:NitT/TauT family transport system substrate-binding protein
MKKAGFILIALLGVMSMPVAAHAKDSEKITLCAPNNMTSALAYIADSQGYFRDEGLDVIFQTTTNGKMCQDSLVAEKAEVMMGGDGPFSYLGFIENPLRIIAQTEESPEVSLIARRDKGILSERDIKGKTVGYLPGSVSYFYLARLLDKLGLNASDLHLVPLQAPAMPQALKGGVIDAFVVWEPWNDQALRELGDRAVSLRDPALYNYQGAVIVTKAFARDHSDQVKGLLHAFLRAESYMHTQPAKAKAYLAKAIRFDLAVIEKNWPNFEFKIKLDRFFISLITDDARLIKRDDPNFKNKPLPDFRKYIEPQFLRDVAPERVEKGM